MPDDGWYCQLTSGVGFKDPSLPADKHDTTMKKSLASFIGFVQIVLVLGIGLLSIGAYCFPLPLPMQPIPIISIPNPSLDLESLQDNDQNVSSSKLAEWLETTYRAQRIIALSS